MSKRAQIIDYDVAMKEWQRLNAEEPHRLRMSIDPSQYDTHKPKRHRPGYCDRCSYPIGTPGLMRGDWPDDGHPYGPHSQSAVVLVRCPLCNNGRGGTR